MKIWRPKKRAKLYKLDSVSNSRRKLAVIVWVALVLAVVLSVGVITVKRLTAPAEGSINQTPPQKAERQDPYPIPANYSGKYMDFTYPAHYKRTIPALTPGYLEVFSSYSTDQTGKQITVGVQKGSLSENSGITYRQAHPELYTQEPRTRLGVTFTAKTTPEKVAFLEHNGLVATVSVTATSNLDLTPDLQTVLSSFTWK